MVSPFMAAAEKVAAVRAALPSLAAGIQLDSATAGPLPVEVTAAMDQLQAYERDVGRADPGYGEDQVQRLDEARAAVAAVLGAGLDEVILTHGAAEGLGLAFDAIADRESDRVPGPQRALTTSDASGAIRRALDAWSRGPRAGGRRVEVVELGGNLDDVDLLDRLDAALDERTILVTVPHVSPATGRVLPIRAIAELGRARGSAVVVDGSQAAGAVPTVVEDLAVDAYAVDGHRWLLGPEALGGLWRPEPSSPDGPRASSAGPEPSSAGGSEPPESLGRFHGPAVVGLARAIGWLSMFVGLEFVHRRGAAMARELRRRLAEHDGVELLTPVDAMATIVTFRIAGWRAEAALDELAHRTFLIARAIQGLDAIRLSPGCWTTADEIERVVETVGLLASHAPGTLPPRRTLAMLGES